MDFRKGESVVVKSFSGRDLQCRVIGVEGEIVLVCGEKEWREAKVAKREPLYVGIRAAELRRPKNSN